jgi:hypothetical protein
MAKNITEISSSTFIVGCTNPQALNYNPNAVIPCIDCCVFGVVVPNTTVNNNTGVAVNLPNLTVNNSAIQVIIPNTPITQTCPEIEIKLNNDVVIKGTNTTIDKQCCDFYNFQYIGDKCIYVPIVDDEIECDIENETDLYITVNNEVKYNNRDLSKVCCDKFGYTFINNKCYLLNGACELNITDVIIINDLVLDKNNRDLNEICCLSLGYTFIDNKCYYIKPVCDLESGDVITLNDKSLFNRRDGIPLDKQCCEFYGFKYDSLSNKCFEQINDITNDCIEINLSNNGLNISDCGDLIIELDLLIKDLKIEENLNNRSSCGQFIPVVNELDGYVLFGNKDFTIPNKQPSLNEECCLAYGYSYDSKLKRCVWDKESTEKNINVSLIEFNNKIDIENKLDYNSLEIGLNNWVKLSGTVSSDIDDFNLGIKLCGFNDCNEYDIYVDNIKILCLNDEVETLINKFDCTGFKLKKVIDNKKSWVYNTGQTINRVFAPSDDADLKWRYTDYLATSGLLEKHSKLVLNTKEVDLLFDFSCINKCENKYSGDTKLNLYDLVNYKNTFRNFWFNFAEQFIPATTIFVSGEKYSNSCDLDSNICVDPCNLPSAILNDELKKDLKTEENCFCTNVGSIGLIQNIINESYRDSKCVKTPSVGNWLSQTNNNLRCNNVIISNDLYIITVNKDNISFNRNIVNNFNIPKKINRIPTNFIRKEVNLFNETNQNNQINFLN